MLANPKNGPVYDKKVYLPCNCSSASQNPGCSKPEPRTCIV